MIFCAASASFQNSGCSVCAFSSARRFVAASKSKMPPQQSDGLLGGFEQILNFSAHDDSNAKERGTITPRRPSLSKIQ
jgi:hypothetical protein